jgi:hypothetical protein
MKISLSRFRPARFFTLAALVGLAASCGPGGKNPGRPGSPEGRVLALSGDTPPTVTIVSPADGATQYGRITVDATISDDAGPVVAAQLLVDGIARQTLRQAPFSFSWDSTGFPDNQHVAQVLAIDDAGNLGASAPILVGVKHRVASLKPSAPWFKSGGSYSIAAAFSGPAPVDGWQIAVTSAPSGVLTHSATFTVREGSVRGSLAVTVAAVSADTSVELTMSLNGATISTTVNVRASNSPVLFDLEAPANLQGGAAGTGTVVLTNVGSVATVFLSSDDPAVQVPASVATGAARTSFAVTTSAVASPRTATITATSPSGFSRTATVNVLPSAVPVPTLITFSAGTIAVGETTTATVALSAPAPPGGALVTLQALDELRYDARFVLPDALVIPEGAQSGDFPVTPTTMTAGFRGVFYARFNGVSAHANDWLYIARDLPKGNASYSTTLKAPACGQLETSCDSGGLLDSRGNALEGPESGTPNTIGSTCLDGTAGGPFNSYFGPNYYHYDQSVDRIRLWTTDGSALAAGKTVNIEVKVWVFGAGNLDLLSAADANNPVWTRIASKSFPPGGIQFGGSFITTFTLPPGPLQAIRANMGGPGPANPPNPCPSDGYMGGAQGNTVDHDDLIFAVGDGQAGTNAAPAVDAGPDSALGLPGVAILVGKVTDDGIPGATTATWSTVSGPGFVSFANPGAAVTGATFSLAGTYVLQLAAGDGALSRSDTVTVTVNSPTNTAPVVNAGVDQTITLPSGTAVAGSVTDDGRPNPPGAVSVTWSQVDGPGIATFASPDAVATDVNFSFPGTYTLRLTANDGALSTSDDVVVVVNDIPNVAPIVNAGADQAIALPGGATLDGTVTDDGRPNPPGTVAVSWSKVTGPGAVTFANADAASTSATFSTAGTYVLRLAANDGALSSSDDVTIVVNPAPVNQAPVVDAGPDRTVTLPAAVALAGVVSDDALPVPHVVTITWSKVSGPGTVTFANAAAASTTATFSAAGSYVLRLRASDGALATTDTVTVTVSPAITLKVQYRAVSPNATDNQIRAGLNIVNVGPTAVPLRELKVRYWYTIDTNRAQTVECESAAIGCARITGTFSAVSPSRPGADRYLEVGFVSTAGNLAAGAQTGEIRGRIRKDNLSNYNEGNDYSYAASLGAAPPTALVDWTRVTLYRNGVRIWGTEP